jgi:hypothetical protein
MTRNKYVNIDIYNDGLYLTFICQDTYFNKQKKLRFPKKMRQDVVDEISRFFRDKHIDWYYEFHDADVT